MLSITYIQVEKRVVSKSRNFEVKRGEMREMSRIQPFQLFFKFVSLQGILMICRIYSKNSRKRV